jgi:hypothetical protein
MGLIREAANEADRKGMFYEAAMLFQLSEAFFPPSLPKFRLIFVPIINNSYYF